MMGCCFALVASETLRRGVPGLPGLDAVTVTLDAVPNPVNRSRAAARYGVQVKVPGAPAPWPEGVVLVDARGYPVAWSYQDVGKWLVKSLSGGAVAVTLVVRDASGLPAKWTEPRLRALGDKVSALSAPGINADAAAKLVTVAGWAVSERRAAVEAAAACMVDAAARVLEVQAMQAGGANWDGSIDPPPVDPPPVDPHVTSLATLIASGLPDSGASIDRYIGALGAGVPDWFGTNQFSSGPVVAPYVWAGAGASLVMIDGGFTLSGFGFADLALRLLESQSGAWVAPKLVGVFCSPAGVGGAGAAAYLTYQGDGGAVSVALFWRAGAASVLVDNEGSAAFTCELVGQVAAVPLVAASVTGWHYGAAAIDAGGVML